MNKQIQNNNKIKFNCNKNNRNNKRTNNNYKTIKVIQMLQSIIHLNTANQKKIRNQKFKKRLKLFKRSINNNKKN